MKEWIAQWPVELGAGVVLVGFIALTTWFEWRFRQRALRVRGEVLKSIRYSKHISHYISYRLGETTKIAEYYNPGLIATLRQGDELDILIDPDDPPNVKVPEGSHIRWSRTGNCVRADSRAIGALDVILVCGGLCLIAHALSRSLLMVP